MGPERFRALLGGDPDDVDLDEAALAMSAALRPGLDEMEWLVTLDAIAGDCPSPTAQGVSRHLFESLGFTGNRDAYYDWRNSCLDHVLAERTGIPLTLSVVMLEVGRRLGVALEGVGMPAHFLVRVSGDPDQLFDPFDGGRRLDRSGARELLERITQGRLRWDDSFVEATSTHDVVVRMLNNLKAVFTARGDRLRLALVMQLREAIPRLRESEAAEIEAASSVFN